MEEVQNPEAVLAELRRAQEDLKGLRAELKSLEAAKTEAESALETLRSAGPDEWKVKALLAETKVALGNQGIKDVERLMPYVGTDGLDFDETGKVTGLDDRLKKLKVDLPEIFDPKVRAGGKADIFANDSVNTPKNSTEAQVDRLFKH